MASSRLYKIAHPGHDGDCSRRARQVHEEAYVLFQLHVHHGYNKDDV